MRIGIAGCGGIGLAHAAMLAQQGHAVTLWSPRGQGTAALRCAPLRADGVITAETRVAVADDAISLVADADVVIIAVPANGHRRVIDAMLPHLRDGQCVFVSATSALSALYLSEAALSRGCHVIVATSGTTVLTARRRGPAEVSVLTRRASLGLSVRPASQADEGVAICRALFGDVLRPDTNMLASTLSNTNPVAHVPLALFNWTRIERAEAWPQYHYMTPRVAAAIEVLDAERLALAHAFGLTVRSIDAHLVASFGAPQAPLAEIAAALHARRGGPPGPTDTATRYLTEDVPFGLVFCAALGRVAGVSMPATDMMIATASLISGRAFARENDLIDPLGIEHATVATLQARLHGGEQAPCR